MAVHTVLKGRGARSNASGRYEPERREVVHDAWTREEDVPARADTTLTPETARTILTRNDSPDVGFDRSINPYRGCEHGCTYCYARPAHAYMGLSPGLDFETKLFFKPDAAALLEKELSNPRYSVDRVHVGGNTDPYQPAERKLKITRQVLEVLDRFEHPVSVITKNALITRDLDILSRMAERRLVKAYVSITTLDPKLARAMEPRASTPARRLGAIRALADAGVPVGVGFAPVIPGLNDHELEAVLAAAAEAGAREAMYVTLRLPLEIKDLFREWLDDAVPDRAERVMSLVRQMRGGRDYDTAFGTRMKGTGPIASMLSARFAVACRKLGLNQPRAELDATRFRRPPKAGDQLALF